MHFSDIFAASLAVAPFVAAHGSIPGAPKIWGLSPIDAAKLKRRDAFGGHARHGHTHAQRDSRLVARQGGQGGACGPSAGGAACDEGWCCSNSGWCGQGEDYCEAPDGLFPYGPANDANVLPAGGSTKNIARPQLGSIPYGGNGVYHCSVPGTVAITYDDGPYLYTQGVLDMFAQYGYKATFFVTGNNNGKGPIDTTANWTTVIQNMIAAGHQVASHTWSHQDLSAITQAQRYEQMIKNEMAFANIMGKFPTYMRPPYSSCTAASGCEADLAALGYVVSYFDLDTDDYNNLSPDKIQIAKNNFNGNVSSTSAKTGDWLSVAHDIHEITATNLTKSMLDELKSLGYKGVTMGECLGDPIANWYRSAPAAQRVATTSSFSAPGSTPTSTVSSKSSTVASTAATPTGSLTVSPDASCGGQTGYTCIGFDSSVGTCCSQYGWCGNDDAHCGTGCQPGFGTCGMGSSSSSAAVASSTRASSSAAASSSSTARSSSASSSVRSSSASSAATSSSAVSSSTLSSSASSVVATSSSASSTAFSSVSSVSVVNNVAVTSSSSSAGASSSSSAASSNAASLSSASSSAGSSSASSAAASSSSVSSSAAASSSSAAASSSVSSLAVVTKVAATSSSSAVASSSSSSSSSAAASSTPAASSTRASSTATSSSQQASSSASSTRASSSSSSTRASSSSSSTLASSTSSSRASSSSTKASSTATPSIQTSIRLAGGSASVVSSTKASSTTTSGAIATPSLSTNGQCGGKTNMICSKGINLILWNFGTISDYGACCSQYGWCGNDAGFCYTENGCQTAYGICY